MISVRRGKTELTDILLTGNDIDIDIQENVRIIALFCGIEIESKIHTK